MKQKIFAPLKNRIPTIFIPATCTKAIRESFQLLLGIEITDHHWPPPHEMATRQISFNLFYSSQPLRLVKQKVKSVLTHDLEFPCLPNKMVIYANRCTRIMHFADSLETFFYSDDELYLSDILRLHGNLSRDEKAQIINLFINGLEATSHLKGKNTSF